MSIPLRRTTLDRLIASAGGQALPDDNQMDDHLNELLDEMSGVVGTVTATLLHDGQVAHAHFGNTSVTYDPAYTAGSANTDDAPFRTACILHELMHFSVDRHYTKPPALLAADMPWESVNFHYGAAAASSFATQSGTVTANLQLVDNLAQADNSLNAAVRAHINGRLIYGMVTPHVHYDTVLLDLLVYLRLKNLAASRTYAYISRLSQEARERRTDSHTATVPAAPAP
jgi:hypothetical protein